MQIRPFLIERKDENDFYEVMMTFANASADVGDVICHLKKIGKAEPSSGCLQKGVFEDDLLMLVRDCKA